MGPVRQPFFSSFRASPSVISSEVEKSLQGRCEEPSSPRIPNICATTAMCGAPNKRFLGFARNDDGDRDGAWHLAGPPRHVTRHPVCISPHLGVCSLLRIENPLPSASHIIDLDIWARRRHQRRVLFMMCRAGAVARAGLVAALRSILTESIRSRFPFWRRFLHDRRIRRGRSNEKSSRRCVHLRDRGSPPRVRKGSTL